MTKKPTKAKPPSDLRARADARLKRAAPGPPAKGDSADAVRLLHELQVHQVELEIQNEELVESRARVEAALAQYTDLYDFSPVGYATLSSDGTISRINLTGARLLGLDRSPLVDRRMDLFVLPSSRPEFQAFLRSVHEGRKSACEIALVKGAQEHLWAHVEGEASENDESVQMVLMDITARVRTEQNLRDSERHFRMIADSAPTLIWLSGPKGQSLYSNQRLLDFTGTSHADQMAGGWSELVHPDDVADFKNACVYDLEFPHVFEHQYRLRRADGQYRWMLDTGVPRFAEDASFLGYIGSILDISERIETSRRLELSFKQRTSELVQLQILSRAVAWADDPIPLLQLILARLRLVVACRTATILALEGPDDLCLIGHVGPLLGKEPVSCRINWKDYVHLRPVFESAETVIIGDISDASTRAVDYRRWCVDQTGFPQADGGSWIGVPLIVAGQTIGVLMLTAELKDAFTPADAELLGIFANYAATAINNTRFTDTVAKTATLNERTRIARELHDSVSQSLFGIVLGLRTSQYLVTNHEWVKVPDTLSYAYSLAEAALSDMRSLIFELHPDAIAQEGLMIALQKQAVSIYGRHQIKVDLTAAPEPNLPLASKEAIYRLTCEALQNIVKHASASHVSISVEMQLEAGLPNVQVRIVDDGRGFNPDINYPGHLGLKSMRERAAGMHGTLGIHSDPGHGTQIVLTVPIQNA